MYWALRVLCEHPWVAAAITQRFDEILVDEAQDTSEVQMACLRKFHQTGTLRSLTLVGDLDQSIASYNGAVPAGCDNLARDRGLHPIVLRENRRCSQLICDVTSPLHSRDRPDVAIGPDRGCSWLPELVFYPADDPAATVDPFRTRLAELGEGPQDAAILARTNDLAQAINGSTSPARMEKALAIARLVNAQRNATLGRHDLDRLDRTLAVLAWGREDLAGEPADTRWALRKASMALLTDAPPLKGDLGSWVTALRRPLADAVALLTDRPRHTVGNWMPVAAAMRDHQVLELLAGSGPVLRARTVHDIKGATRGGVMFVLGKATARRNPAALLGSALAGRPVAQGDAEEARIAYVALTRARRLCRVALPDTTPDQIVRLFTASGFHVYEAPSVAVRAAGS